MIVPFAPGGTTDFFARIVQPKMQELLGQPVVDREPRRRRRQRRHGAGRHARRRTAISSSWATSARSRINASIFKDRRSIRRSDFVAVVDHRRHAVAAGHEPELPAEHGAGAGRLSQGAPRPGELRIAGQRQPEPPGHGAVRREGRREDQSRALQGRLGSGRSRHHGRPYPVHVRHHRRRLCGMFAAIA